MDGHLGVKISLDEYQVQALDRVPLEISETDYSNLVVEYDLGWASLLSSSSILKNEGEDISDFFLCAQPYSWPV